MAYQNQEGLYIVLLAGTGGMVLLVFFIVLFVMVYQKKMITQQLKMQRLHVNHQKNMTGAVVQTQEKERKVLAENLHDDVGGILSGLKTNMQLIKEPNTGSIADWLNLLDTAIANVRRISMDLVPLTLEQFGLVDAVKNICCSFNASGKMNIEFNFHGNEDQRFDENIEINCFRIVNELLINAIKHSGATTISVTMACNNHWLDIEVTDNGKGFDHQACRKMTRKKGSFGLMNIEGRVNFLEGIIQWESRPGEYSTCKIKVPLDHGKH